MKTMKTVDTIVGVLLVIGGINWGFVGLFDFNLIANIFGGATFWDRLVYAFVGAAAVYDIVLWRAIKRRWHCTETYREHVPVQ